MRIVTSGKLYLDIDAYAGCIAYAELLRATGTKALAISTAPLNESISPKTRQWPVQLEHSYYPSPDDTFTLIDVSDPSQFDTFVDLAQVDEVIDHHLGFEQYWLEKTDVEAQIEFVGAACTQVYERWVTSGQLNKMSKSSARLLICGILDNTLNLGANITSKRDTAAYSALLGLAKLPYDWPAQYFSDCETTIFANIAEAVRNDTKNLKFLTFDKPMLVGQLVVWDGKSLLQEHQALIEAELGKLGPNWFMNLISLSDRCSYFVSDNVQIKEWLSGLLKLRFKRSTAAAEGPWLRKEIVKQDIDHA